MNVVFFLIGLGLVVGGLLDAVQTTIGANKGGWLTSRITQPLWNLGKAVYKKFPSRHFLYSYGRGLILTVIAVWMILIWVGWFLIYLVDPNNIQHTSSGEPVEMIDRLYFIGMLLSTVGTGDVSANAPLWRLLSALVAFSGFFVATLGISYLISLISAATHRRTLASSIARLGCNVDDILERHWDGKGFSSLTTPFENLIPMVEQFSQNHFAYPSLAYVHSLKKAQSPSINLANLFDLILVLERCGPMVEKPSLILMRDLRRAIEKVLRVTTDSDCDFEEPADPPVPRLEKIQKRIQTGFPEYDPELRKLRRCMARYIDMDGWKTEDVVEVLYF